MKTTRTREDCEAEIIRLSKLDRDHAWLVVDCGGIDRTQYRVWSEDTLDDQEAFCPDCVPAYELISRAENGQLLQIA